MDFFAEVGLFLAEAGHYRDGHYCGLNRNSCSESAP
jgi:hypothetical protein